MSGASTPHYITLQNMLSGVGGAALIGESGGGTVEEILTALESAVALKSALASPEFTGVPTVPTAALDTDTLQIASTAFVINQISALIGAAPGALNTLEEIADALADDDDYAGTIVAALALKAPLASPEFTGVPTVPTAALDTDTTQVASTAFVNAQVNAGSAMDLLATAVADGDTVVEFTDIFTADYTNYLIDVSNMKPSNGSAIWYMRMSTDNGVTWGTAYQYNLSYGDASTFAGIQQTTTVIRLMNGLLSSAVSGQMRLVLHNPLGASPTFMSGVGVASMTAGTMLNWLFSGRRTASDAVNAIQFYMSPLVGFDGEFKVYGLK